MHFIENCEQIIEKYKACNDFSQEDNALRLGLDPEKERYSGFTFFDPIDINILSEFIQSKYTRCFPKSLMELYHQYNGVDMFNAKIAHSKINYIAVAGLLLFGFPSFPRHKFEPYNIQVEDLARGLRIKKSWLKCGIYVALPKSDERYDIYIDTDDERVYLTENRKSITIESFDTLDNCLCDLYRRLCCIDLSKIINQ